MSYTIDQFGFEPIDQIPVERNDWGEMLTTFMASDVAIVKREFEDTSKASNAAGGIRKAAEAQGVSDRVSVINKAGVIYIQKV